MTGITRGRRGLSWTVPCFAPSQLAITTGQMPPGVHCVFFPCARPDRRYCAEIEGACPQVTSGFVATEWRGPARTLQQEHVRRSTEPHSRQTPSKEVKHAAAECFTDRDLQGAR